jgi:plasmid stabilization system protein ParE
MPNLEIRFHSEALHDINSTRRYIINELFKPLTAQKYKDGILNAIQRLSVYGSSIAPNQREYIQKRYGPNARTIIYKKMTIIYNVIEDIVFIRRVIAGGLIL